jgi:hypothetical protein
VGLVSDDQPYPGGIVQVPERRDRRIERLAFMLVSEHTRHDGERLFWKGVGWVDSRFSDLRQDIKAPRRTRGSCDAHHSAALSKISRDLYGAVRGRRATAHYPRSRRPMSF